MPLKQKRSGTDNTANTKAEGTHKIATAHTAAEDLQYWCIEIAYRSLLGRLGAVVADFVCCSWWLLKIHVYFAQFAQSESFTRDTSSNGNISKCILI